MQNYIDITVKFGTVQFGGYWRLKPLIILQHCHFRSFGVSKKMSNYPNIDEEILRFLKWDICIFNLCQE